MAADALAAGSVFTEKWLVNIGLIGEVHMSIKKIAEKAGVSISTVSRILNRPDYKCSVPGLREKVWDLAMEMNYVPNEAARNLKKGTLAKENSPN